MLPWPHIRPVPLKFEDPLYCKPYSFSVCAIVLLRMCHTCRDPYILSRNLRSFISEESETSKWHSKVTFHMSVKLWVLLITCTSTHCDSWLYAKLPLSVYLSVSNSSTVGVLTLEGSLWLLAGKHVFVVKSGGNHGMDWITAARCIKFMKHF